MNPIEFYRTTVGKKAIMAVTGILLLGFLVAHLLGNLTVYLGPEALNGYAQKLRDLGELLWVMRIGLLTIFLLHIVTAMSLARRNKKSRPINYAVAANVQSTYASRTMVVSGLTILVYVGYHLSHFTFGWLHSSHRAGHDVYAMVVSSFQQPGIAVAYILSMVLLCFHLSHGVAVFIQTLGLNRDIKSSHLQCMGRLFATVLSLGYASIPIAVQLGLVQLH
ncbi:MAG: succinate dehydrogenase / fumarate reductase cytochrome b subunit [Candidatus Omnitrophota bacterium]|jgi:succinate dehydrogenase / fumarate reductase cytochrome b subunit